jgi:cell division protein FtsI (penicillin-binding protein 3)
MAKPQTRLRVVQVAFALGIAAVIVRAAQVQLVEGARHRVAAVAQRTERVELPARRGTLYDRNGTPLAVSREAYHVGVARNELRDGRRDALAIARALRLSTAVVRRALTRPYAYFHGPFTAAQVEPLRTLRGVHLTQDLERFYPRPNFARAVIGRPGADGRPAGGIERVFDSLLAGIPGSAVVLRDREGRRYESPARLDAFPVAGYDVYLTLDADLQDIAEGALAGAIERYDAAGGDIVMLDPATGEVLAVASRRADGSTPPTAFTAVFEPGSTAKLFAAAALLARDKASPRDSVWGEGGTYVMPHRTVRDDHPEGWLTLRRAVEVSSNIGVIKFAARLEPEQHFETLRDFGLGTPTGIEFPAEARGTLPRPDRWSGTSQASLAMGYEIAVTPLQLAQAYGAVANGGVLMRPTLLREVRSPAGRQVYRHVPEPVRRVVRDPVARELRSMLRGVVYEGGGTGSTAALTSFDLAGKTGTARRAGPAGYIEGGYTATFAALFPADEPQVVLVVKLDDPRGAYARLSAAPVTRAVLEQALAARTASLDRAWLARSTHVPPGPLLASGGVPYVVAWPADFGRAESVTRPVPDVRGLGLRAAARLVHRNGFRVQVRGWGRVVRTVPPPGDGAATGSLVTLFAEGGGR